MRFSNWKVCSKLIVVFITIALVGAIIGLLGIRSLAQINAMADNMYEQETLGIRYAGEAQAKLVTIGRTLRNAFLASTVDGRQKAMQTIETLFDELDKSLKQAHSSFHNEEERATVIAIQESVDLYKQDVREILDQMHTQPYFSESRLTRQIRDVLIPNTDRAEALMQQVINQKNQFAAQYNQQIETVFNKVSRSLMLVTLFGALIGVVLGLLLTRGLMRQLGAEPAQVRDVADAIAQGKLYTALSVPAKYTGSVMHSISIMQTALRRIVQEVRASSHNIATGTSQIAAGNMDLSQRTEEQAASLTQTAAAMHQMASTLESNAQSAQQAAQLVSVARESAAKGELAVGEVISTMDEIQSSSSKISEIINVIDGIAFQTNILALNAAVEAARAGVQGRGFAVVASEVRTLAQRSAAAAQDIKQLIETSHATVGGGAKKVDFAGQVIQEMVGHINRVTTLIEEISAATLEQNAGVEQVTQAVGQLDEVTQQNAALVEQSAVAAANLNDQADHLVRTVSVFELGEVVEQAAVSASLGGQVPAASTALLS